MPHRVVAAANPLRPRQVVKARLKNAVPCDAERLFHFRCNFAGSKPTQVVVSKHYHLMIVNFSFRMKNLVKPRLLTGIGRKAFLLLVEAKV